MRLAIYLLIALFVGAANADPASANNGPSIPEFRIVWETKLDESFLRREPDESGAGTNQSEFGLYVDSSIYEDQFIAGYQAVNGQRLLIMGAVDQKGHVNFRILSYDKQLETVNPAVTFATVQEEQALRASIYVGGVDVLRQLTEIQMGAPAKQRARVALVEFLVSEVGQAYLEAIPVAMIHLTDMSNDSPAVSSIAHALGASRMASEVASGYFAGWPLSNVVLNMNDYQVFRNACEDIYCQLFTGRFTIHENGFFDVLTDIPTAINCLTEGKAHSVVQYENSCFGCCGPGCMGCSGVYADDCLGHDQCVCERSHLSCIFSAGGSCGGVDCNGPGSSAGFCSSLISAIIDFFRCIFGGCGSTNFPDPLPPPGGPGMPPWPNPPCYSIAECTPCLGNPGCMPQFPTDPY